MLNIDKELKNMNDFNWITYLKNYPDLKEHNINNEEKAYKHYLEYGKNEGRIYYDLEKIKYFDWITYLNNYPDLKEHGIDTEEKAKDHYLNKGMKEYRVFYNLNDSIYNDFDWKKYVSENSDLNNLGLNKIDTIFHWLNYGNKEGRTFYKYSSKGLPLDFVWNEYISLYKDLKDSIHNEDDAIEHYLNHGIYEGRIYNYKNDIINKIDFIDNILWINLDRCIKRSDYMNHLLDDLKVKNTRICAIDGNVFDTANLINVSYGYNLSKYEIACTLSHIKAIDCARNLCGNYFMICEDDISFDNLKYFNSNLGAVIKDAPQFDILMLYKTYQKDIKNNYEKWTEHYSENPLNHIGGTVCYIISKSGINKMASLVKYSNENNICEKFIFNKKYPLHVADIFIYNYLETIVYKYNYITTLVEESTIHNNHLDYHNSILDYQLNVIKNNYP